MMLAPISLGETTDPCANDVTQWVVMRSTENGRCFNVCMADPTKMYEVDCPDRLLTGGIRNTGTGTRSPLSGQTIIQGVPNWVVIGGAAVVGIMIANR